jgi:arylsulfatase A-like enzyme
MSAVSVTRRQFVAAGASAAIGGAALSLRDQTRRAGPPNVLVIMVDTLRTDHAFGDHARTPNIDALTKRGLRFTRAVPEAMPTIPVRNSFLSGRRGFPFRNWHDYPGLMNSPGWAPLKDIDATWTSTLRKAGFWTGYVTDNPFLGFSSPYDRLRASFDLFIRHGGQVGGTTRGISNRELNHWMHPSIEGEKTALRLRRYLANGGKTEKESDTFAGRVFSSGAAALKQAALRQPFALVVDTFAPHEPWTPPKRYLDMYGDPDWRGPEPGTLRYGRVTKWLNSDEAPRVLKRLRALYAAEVTMTDRWIGVLLDQLYDLKLDGDTIVVLVADHGIFLGERGWTGKISIALHHELTRVPLVIVHPQGRRGGDSTAYRASPHDIGRTVLKMTGVSAPPAMEGIDLSRLFRGADPPRRDYAYGGYGNSHYLRSDRWTFFADNLMRKPHLFDHRADPSEVKDLAGRFPGVVRELHQTVIERAEGRLPYYPDA